jgi:hypothetical protein
MKTLRKLRRAGSENLKTTRDLAVERSIGLLERTSSANASMDVRFGSNAAARFRV